MILFCLDTSGPVAGVAIIQDGAVRYEAMAVNNFTHSQSILPMTEEAFRHTGLDVNQTDYFAVTVGPGSFTGVRIGVSTVKGLAHAAGKPCIAVDALEAMAAGVTPFGGVICPIQDARAGQVYGAAFRGGERLADDCVLRLDEYLQQISPLGERFLFTGDGVTAYREQIAEAMGEKARFAPPQSAYLRPAAVACLAARDAAQAVDYLTLQPLYLRAPQAERERSRREAQHG